MSGVRDLLELYGENGPVRLCRYLIGNRGQEIGVHSAFGVEGYLVLLTGCKVPYRNTHTPTADEWQRWNAHKAELAAMASNGMTVEESLAYIRADPTM